MIAKNNNHIAPKVKVSLFLERHEVDFIDALEKDAMFSTGHKLNRSEVIGAILDTAEQLQLDAKNIHSKEELLERIIQKLGEKNMENLRNILKPAQESKEELKP